MDLNALFTRAYWVDVAGSDFRLGFVVALAAVAVVFVILVLLQLTLMWILRTRSVSRISVPYKNGDVIITREAVFAAVSNALREFGLAVRKISLCRKKNDYRLTVYTAMQYGAPVESINQSKEAARAILNSQFAVNNISRVHLVVEKINNDGSRQEKNSNAAVDSGI